MKTYKAPWSSSLVLVSVLVVVILIGAAAILLLQERYRVVAWLPLALVAGAALFVIRGYSISPDTVFVRRLFWSTRLPVRDLESVQAEADAMRRSLRLCGNGGLFSFTGVYRNKTLGRYRAFVTDPDRAVVLRYPGRKVVLSPADPDDFVRELNSAREGSR